MDLTRSDLVHAPGNVKRRRDGMMVKRWAVAGMLDAERSFRRVKGCKDMHTLVAPPRSSRGCRSLTQD